MTWFLLNKVLALLSPKARAAYTLITPLSLGAVYFVGAHGTRDTKAILSTPVVFNYLSFVLYQLSAALYDLFCPEQVKGIKSFQEYLSRLQEGLKLLKEHNETRRSLLQETIQSRLAVHFGDQAKGLATEWTQQIIAEQQGAGLGADPSNPQSIGTKNRPLLLVCSVLLLLAGVFACTSIWFGVAGPFSIWFRSQQH